MVKNLFVSIAIFLIAFILYLSFPSNEYTAVDGTMRCLPYMNNPSWKLNPNNHMLYPVNVILWSRLMRILFNIKPADPFNFIRMIELMNSFFASIGVAAFFLILKKITSNLKISLWGTCMLACSNAFIVNAVNSNEPMVGFVISIISIVFTYAWLNSNKIFLGVIGALLLSLSAATFMSMFLIAPSMLVLVILFSFKNNKASVIRNAVLYIFFVASTYAVIYFLSHWVINGEHSFQVIIKKLFFLDGVEIAGKLSFAKFLAVPFVAIYGIIHLDNMRNGVRAFFSEQPFNSTILIAIVLYILFVIFFAALIYISFKIFKKIDKEKKIFLIVSVVGIICTLFAPIFWSITYTKILLQPVIILITITALISSEIDKFANRFISVSLKSFLSIFLVFVIFWNLNNVLLKMHFQTSELKAAKELAERVDDESLIIIDWDSDVATLYSEFYKNPQQHIFCIQYEMTMLMLKGERAEFIHKLKDEITSFKNNGKKVYFLGVLEKSRSMWRYYLEERLHIDYDLFDEYRRSARFIKKFDKTSLYEY